MLRPDSSGTHRSRAHGEQAGADRCRGKRDTTETYSTNVPGVAGDDSLQPVQRETTLQRSTPEAQRTVHQIEQPRPGESSDGLHLTQEAIDIVRPGASGTTDQSHVVLTMGLTAGSLKSGSIPPKPTSLRCQSGHGSAKTSVILNHMVRMFIKILTAIALSRAHALVGVGRGRKLTNWAGTQYSTDRLYSATSLEQVRLRERKPGSRRWARIASTTLPTAKTVSSR